MLPCFFSPTNANGGGVKPKINHGSTKATSRNTSSRPINPRLVPYLYLDRDRPFWANKNNRRDATTRTTRHKTPYQMVPVKIYSYPKFPLIMRAFSSRFFGWPPENLASFQSPSDELMLMMADPRKPNGPCARFEKCHRKKVFPRLVSWSRSSMKL